MGGLGASARDPEPGGRWVRCDAMLVEGIGRWAAELSAPDIPAAVVDGARAQRRSVVGGIAASSRDASTHRLVAAVESWAGPGPAAMVLSDRQVAVDDALYAASAASVALDFDDYLCFGHTGHSAVLTPMLLAAETGASGIEQLTAQIVANELEGRIGGATLVGPLNGQMSTHIHAAGAAVAAGRLLGLDGTRMAHALALALAHPIRATVPGFMGPDSKLSMVAESTVAGLRAARLAACGVTGPLDALDHPGGVVAALSFAPLREALGGLGEAWTTTTLSVKPYPGCAYVDTTLDAVLSLDLGPVEPNEIESVSVHAGVLTCAMDALSAPYAATDAPSPVTVTFSVPWNVAVALRAGRVSEDEIREDWLSAHRTELVQLRDRVRIEHDPALTSRSVEAFTDVVPPRRLLAALGPRQLATAATALRREHPVDLGGAREIVELARELVRTRPGSGSTRWWDPTALEAFRFEFPSRVTVRLRDGTERSAEASVPRGGAGNRDVPPSAVARRKLLRCGARLWGEARTAEIDDAITHDDAGLHDRLGGAPGER